MPRKTKDQKQLEEKNEKKSTINIASSKQAKKVASTKKTTNTKTQKNANTEKKTTTKKSTPSATKKKTNTEKKVATKKSNTKTISTTSSKTQTTKKKTTTSTTKKKANIVEYYDLPYRYNQTIVKVLAQTPTNLFIYWDISDTDRKNLEKQYGADFFTTTRPVLIIHNDTLDYHFEVEINDFANSWYLHVADSKCDYRIELGRRPIVKTDKLNMDYIYVTTSNEIESPNDRILFDNKQKMVYFRNVKTGKETSKPISSISFMRNMGKIYDIYDLYKIIYQNENIGEQYHVSNPSSGSFSSLRNLNTSYCELIDTISAHILIGDQQIDRQMIEKFMI